MSKKLYQSVLTVLLLNEIDLKPADTTIYNKEASHDDIIQIHGYLNPRKAAGKTKT